MALISDVNSNINKRLWTNINGRSTIVGMPRRPSTGGKKVPALPTRLRQVRKSKGLTQAKLAELSGVTQGMISQLEAKQPGTDYSGKTLKKLADALGCRPQDLMMSDPNETEGPYDLFESLDDADKARAIEILRGLKRAAGR
jgi:transcriptional regulator with XRE-family HTH domain